MKNPEITFDEEHYYAPFEPPEYPTLSEGYLPANVHVHFSFGRHMTYSDFEARATLLQGSDIYLPEIACQQPQQISVYQRFAKSSGLKYEKLAKKYVRAEYERGEVEALKGSWITVAGINPTPQDGVPANSKVRPSTHFETEMEEVFRYLYTLTQHIRYRDAITLSKMGPVLNETARQHPKLKDKARVNALAAYGRSHESLFTILSNNKHVSQQVSASCDIRSAFHALHEFKEEAMQNIYSNKKVPRQQLAAIIIGRLLPTLTSFQWNHEAYPAQSQWILQDTLLKLVVEGDSDKVEDNARTMHRLYHCLPRPGDSALIRQYEIKAREKASDA